MNTIGPYELNSIVTGDARELAQAIPDESVDLVLTDPPFGIGFDDWDKVRGDDYIDLIDWLISESTRIVKPGGLCFVFQASLLLRETWPRFPDGSRIFVAAKNFVQMRGDIPYAFDPVVFWRKSGEPLTKGNGRDWHIGNTANTNNRGIADAGWHPCPRPLSTIIYMVENFCPTNGIVYDFYMGSGTTAVAAKLTLRNWLGTERDSEYAERARARVANTQPPLFVPQHEQLEMTA